MTIDLHGCVPDGEIEAGSGLGRGSPVKMPRSWCGAGTWLRTLAWTAIGTASGKWSARGQFCSVWHLVGGGVAQYVLCPAWGHQGAWDLSAQEDLVRCCTHSSLWAPHGALFHLSGGRGQPGWKDTQKPSKGAIRQLKGAQSSPCCDQLSSYSL